MYIHMYTYVNICIYIYIDTCDMIIYMYSHIYIYVCIYIYVYTCMYTYVYTHMYIHICLYIYLYTNNMYTHLYWHLYTLYLHQYIHIDTYRFNRINKTFPTFSCYYDSIQYWKQYRYNIVITIIVFFYTLPDQTAHVEFLKRTEGIVDCVRHSPHWKFTFYRWAIEYLNIYIVIIMLSPTLNISTLS
jgi:hypothetical protein